MSEIKKYDYHVALITATATEEAGLRYMYEDWKPIFLEGDVIVPDVVWDYSSGKFVSSQRAKMFFGGVGFIPRPHFINTDEAMPDAVKCAMESPINIKSLLHLPVLSLPSFYMKITWNKMGKAEAFSLKNLLEFIF